MSKEISWVRYFNSNHQEMFLLTSSQNRDWYYLYSIDSGNQKRIGKGRTPIEIEEKLNIERALQ